MLPGIDVSDWQGVVDWEMVKRSGVAFAYAKATEGLGQTEKTFASNWAGIAAAQLERGAYHMFHFDEDPIAQAQYFLEVASPVPGDLPPALDLERGNSKSADGAVEAVLLFLNALRRVVKEPAVIYVGHDFWANSLGATTELADNPLWFPHYADTPTPSGVPAPWPKWTFWQHSQNAAVDGITPPVDLDWFNGDEVALLQFALGGNPDGK